MSTWVWIAHWLVVLAYVGALLGLGYWGMTVPSPLPCPTCATDSGAELTYRNGVRYYSGPSSPKP